MLHFTRLFSILFSLAVIFNITPIYGQNDNRSEKQNKNRPNILLILADDVGYSDLGCYGGEIRTPNLDALAAGGIRFTQFYNTTRCCPSRASINTGLYPHQAGIGNMEGHSKRIGYEGYLTDRCVTLAEVLKDAGYRTLMSGKWHMGQPGPIKRGFEEFFGLIDGFRPYFNPQVHTRLPQERTVRKYNENEYYATDVFTDYALDFLEESRKTNQSGERSPFFLYLAYTAAHFPLQAPKEEIVKYADAYTKGWDVIRETRFMKQKELGILDKNIRLPPRGFVPSNWSNIQTGWADKDNPAWETIDEYRRADLARRMAIYAAMIDRMDQNIGRVVEDLKKNGEFDNTLIIFLSDNGACAEWDPWGFDRHSGPQNILHKNDELEKMGSPGTYHSTGSGWANVSNTPWKLYKHYIHEGGIRTPMIAHWSQGIKRKGMFEKSVGHIIDFMPTFVELAETQYPTERNENKVLPMEGKSLTGAFRGEPQQERILFWEHEDNRGVREGDSKLVWLNARKQWELYDLKNDPTEQNDLAPEQQEKVSTMSNAWEKWAKRAFVK
ncbi:MAG: arylsulfatase [Planctomycetaceae bacterium]|jgi:arylsulfatase|nr:arylsulfatase [Planctomycetaceae bacterium]